MVKIVRAEVSPMKTNSKLVLAVGLAAATLALVLINVLGGPALLQSAGLAAAIVISAIALAAGAYALSRKQRSYPVAGLLALSGIILMTPAIIATGYFTVIVFPGPILGVIFGLVILGLGVAKGISSARAKEMIVR
jgi:O-antigen/teichoic acid export membrane protein